MAWAFVGGLAVDILTQRPLGSSSFSLLIAVGVGGIIGGFLGRIRIVAPIGATAVASPLYSMLILLTTTALTTSPIPSAAISAIVPSTVYDVILAAAFGPLAVAIAARDAVTSSGSPGERGTARAEPGA